METTTERINRIFDIDIYLCPHCKKGPLMLIAILPPIHAPDIKYFSTQYHPVI